MNISKLVGNASITISSKAKNTNLAGEIDELVRKRIVFLRE
jgi:hypothetical protein